MFHGQFFVRTFFNHSVPKTGNITVELSRLGKVKYTVQSSKPFLSPQHESLEDQGEHDI